jgi:hypothetical protein
MVRPAERHKVVGCVSAALRTALYVVRVEAAVARDLTHKAFSPAPIVTRDYLRVNVFGYCPAFAFGFDRAATLQRGAA